MKPTEVIRQQSREIERLEIQLDQMKVANEAAAKYIGDLEAALRTAKSAITNVLQPERWKPGTCRDCGGVNFRLKNMKPICTTCGADYGD